MPFDTALTQFGGTQVFSTNNNVSVTTGSGNTRRTSWGICGSMSARWINESLKHGKALTRASDIGTELNIGITQAAFELTAEGSMSKYLFEIFDLKPEVTKVGTILSWRGIMRDAMTLSGYISFTIKGNGGHAMGLNLVSGGGESHFFDPNCGLYSFLAKDKCVLAVANHMKAKYDKWKSGEYKLYQVTRA